LILVFVLTWLYFPWPPDNGKGQHHMAHRIRMILCLGPCHKSALESTFSKPFRPDFRHIQKIEIDSFH